MEYDRLAGSVPAFRLRQPKDVECPAARLRLVQPIVLEFLPNRRLSRRQPAVLLPVQLTPLEFPQPHHSFRTSFPMKNPRREIMYWLPVAIVPHSVRHSDQLTTSPGSLIRTEPNSAIHERLDLFFRVPFARIPNVYRSVAAMDR